MKPLLIIMLLFTLSLSTECFSVEDNQKKELDIEQFSYGATQMFVVQRQIRLEQFQQAMKTIASYLRDDITNFQSKQVLHQRMEELDHASRVANALAALHGDVIPGMRMLLEHHGQSKEQIQEALPRLLGDYAPTKNVIVFAQYHLLFNAIREMYGYIDLNWKHWDVKEQAFNQDELKEIHQRLEGEIAEAINLLAEVQK